MVLNNGCVIWVHVCNKICSLIGCVINFYFIDFLFKKEAFKNEKNT